MEADTALAYDFCSACDFVGEARKTLARENDVGTRRDPGGGNSRAPNEKNASADGRKKERCGGAGAQSVGREREGRKMIGGRGVKTARVAS